MAKRQTKALTLPDAGKDVEPLGQRMQNGMATLEMDLTVSYKIAYTLHVPSIPLLFTQEK